MENGREIIKQILILILILTVPALIGWVFGAWGAIVVLTIVLCIITHYVMKYQC